MSFLEQRIRERPRPGLADGPLAQPPPERFSRRGLSLRPAPPETEIETITLDELPAMLQAELTTYVQTPNPGYGYLVAFPPGGGKTYQGVRLAERLAAGGKRVLYAGPYRAFYADVQAEQQRPAWWYQWQPRSTGDFEAVPPRPATCRWEPQISAWMQRGYEAMDFCSNPRICGWDYIRERCPFHRQKGQPENIIFGQHAHAALGHPLMDQFALLIGDELPISAFLHRWTIPLTAIVPPNMASTELETLLRNLKWLAVNPPDDKPFWEGTDLYRYGIPGGAKHVLDTIPEVWEATSADAYLPELRSAGQAEDAPYYHLLTLGALLRREAKRVLEGQEVLPRIRLDAEGLTLLLRRDPPKNLPEHIVWLDATGDAGIYQTLFDRPFKVVRPQVAMKGRIHQVWASANNRGACLDERPDVDGQPLGEKKLGHVRAQIARIMETHAYERPAVVSYKPIAHKLIPGAPHTHFGASRGTNALQGCDALFVVGAPLPNIAAIKEMAAMLFFERDEPFRDDWHAVDVPFTGQAAAHTVGGFWDDPDLALLVRQVREAELIQAVHRARPLRRDVDVWLLTNVVAPGLPVQLVGLHDLFDANDAQGQPLRGIDIERWPSVLALPASDANPLTVARLIDELHITKPTAGKWLDALARTGRYRQITLEETGRRGPKTRAVVKSFNASK